MMTRAQPSPTNCATHGPEQPSNRVAPAPPLACLTHRIPPTGAASKRRAERTGSERVHRDAGSGKLGGEAAGELDDSALAGRVPGAGRAGYEPECAGEGEDTAAPGVAHGPGGCAAGEPGSHHVDLQAYAQIRGGQLIDGPRACTPALVTSTSSRPYADSTRSTRPATASSSVTSHAWPSTGRPVWAVSRPAACSQRSAERLASTTADPARASVPTIPSPRPAKPPVTTDTCPARGEAAGRSAGEGLRDSSVTQECSQNRLLARRSISAVDRRQPPRRLREMPQD
jgi:hypothetical protein